VQFAERSVTGKAFEELKIADAPVETKPVPGEPHRETREGDQARAAKQGLHEKFVRRELVHAQIFVPRENLRYRHLEAALKNFVRIFRAELLDRTSAVIPQQKLPTPTRPRFRDADVHVLREGV
jgi:hypothetical protein